MDNGWQDRKIARLQACKTWGDPSGQPKQPVNQNIPEILQSCNLTILQSHDLGIRCPSNMSGTSSHWPRIFPWMLQSYNLTILQSCDLTILQSCDLAICCPWETSGTSSPRARIFSEILQSYNLAILQSYNLSILHSHNLTFCRQQKLSHILQSCNLTLFQSCNLAIWCPWEVSGTCSQRTTIFSEHLQTYILTMLRPTCSWWGPYFEKNLHKRFMWTVARMQSSEIVRYWKFGRTRASRQVAR